MYKLIDMTEKRRYSRIRADWNYNLRESADICVFNY